MDECYLFLWVGREKKKKKIQAAVGINVLCVSGILSSSAKIPLEDCIVKTERINFFSDLQLVFMVSFGE